MSCPIQAAAAVFSLQRQLFFVPAHPPDATESDVKKIVADSKQRQLSRPEPPYPADRVTSIYMALFMSLSALLSFFSLTGYKPQYCSSYF